MKLTKEEMKFIENAARVAALFEVDKLIIDELGCRGINEDRTVYINQPNDNMPTLSFESFCILRIPLFLSRLDIARSQEDFETHVSLHQDGWITCVTFKGKGTKIEYRGSNPVRNTVHKSLNDDRAIEIPINGEAIVLMQKGISAMSAKQIKIISNDEVTFEFTDVNSDVFSYTFPDKAEAVIAGGTTRFAHKYPAKLVMTLFKREPNSYFSIGGRIGTLCVNVDGIDVYIIPQK